MEYRRSADLLTAQMKRERAELRLLSDPSAIYAKKRKIFNLSEIRREMRDIAAYLECYYSRKFVFSEKVGDDFGLFEARNRARYGGRLFRLKATDGCTNEEGQEGDLFGAFGDTKGVFEYAP